MSPIVILVLGIVGLAYSPSLIGLISAIVTLILAKKADSEDDKVKIGKILAIIGLIHSGFYLISVLFSLLLYILFIVLYFGFIIAIGMLSMV